MSYCRWSTDDFQCDLYVYADVAGGYTTHVAGNRPVFDKPLPPVVIFADNPEAWMKRHAEVMRMMDGVRREPIGLGYDGQTFRDETPEDLLATLTFLRDAGYRFPQEVLDEVESEIVEAEDGNKEGGK